MTKVVAEITASLDGFVAGPNQTLAQPLGAGGNKLHEWVVRLKTFRELHGMDAATPTPTKSCWPRPCARQARS